LQAKFIYTGDYTVYFPELLLVVCLYNDAHTLCNNRL